MKNLNFYQPDPTDELTGLQDLDYLGEDDLQEPPARSISEDLLNDTYFTDNENDDYQEYSDFLDSSPASQVLPEDIPDAMPELDDDNPEHDDQRAKRYKELLGKVRLVREEQAQVERDLIEIQRVTSFEDETEILDALHEKKEMTDIAIAIMSVLSKLTDSNGSNMHKHFNLQQLYLR